LLTEVKFQGIAQEKVFGNLKFSLRNGSSKKGMEPLTWEELEWVLGRRKGNWPRISLNSLGSFGLRSPNKEELPIRPKPYLKELPFKNNPNNNGKKKKDQGKKPG